MKKYKSFKFLEKFFVFFCFFFILSCHRNPPVGEFDRTSFPDDQGEGSSPSEDSQDSGSGNDSSQSNLQITPLNQDGQNQDEGNTSSNADLDRALYESAGRSSSSSLDEMKNLLEQGANPNVIFNKGVHQYTALIESIIREDEQKVRLLVEEYNADVNLGTPKPLVYTQIGSSSEKMQDIIRTLESKGATSSQ